MFSAQVPEIVCELIGEASSVEHAVCCMLQQYQYSCTLFQFLPVAVFREGIEAFTIYIYTWASWEHWPLIGQIDEKAKYSAPMWEFVSSYLKTASEKSQSKHIGDSRNAQYRKTNICTGSGSDFFIKFSYWVFYLNISKISKIKIGISNGTKKVVWIFLF